MLNNVLISFWLFLPAGCANIAPILAAKLPLLSCLNFPLDGYATWNNQRIFGDHKTIRGLIAAILVGGGISLIQFRLFTPVPFQEFDRTSPLIWGSLLGCGAILGDAVKSFFKRRVGIQPGQSWLLFDQIDYILGAISASLIVVRLPLVQYFYLIVGYALLHFIVSFLGYLFGFKDQPL